jgi:hypothetical protein
VDIFQIEKASKGEESKISSIYVEANLWAQQVQELLWDESEINRNEIGKWIENQVKNIHDFFIFLIAM